MSYTFINLTRLVLVLAIVAYGGCCNTMESDTTILEQADAAYREGRFTEAEGLYHSVLKVDSGNVRALEQTGILALWKNDLVNAESSLQSALKSVSFFKRHWPLNTQTVTRMAIVYVRSGRFDEAAALLNRAAGPLPLGPFKAIKTRARQLEQFKGEAPYQIEGSEETTIPFVITDPLPVVKVSINGSDPVNFNIDTGGEGILLDADFAKEVNAVIVGEIAEEYAGGKRGKTGYGKIHTLRMGDVSVRNVPMSSIDMKPISTMVFDGMDIKGVIGTGFLMQFLATIDYPNRQLVLRKSGTAEYEVGESAEVSGSRHIFPFWLVETHLIFVEGSIMQLEPGKMFIDTGLAGAGFLASKKIYTKAGVDMDWSKAAMGMGGGGMTMGLGVFVDKVTLGTGSGAVTRRNINGVVFKNDISLFNNALGFKVAGLISHEFFRPYAVTFDFVNMNIIITGHIIGTNQDSSL